MLGLREAPGLRLGSRYAMGEVKSLSRREDMKGSGPGRQPEEGNIWREFSEVLSTKELGREDPSACGSYMDWVRWVK